MGKNEQPRAGPAAVPRISASSDLLPEIGTREQGTGNREQGTEPPARRGRVSRPAESLPYHAVGAIIDRPPYPACSGAQCAPPGSPVPPHPLRMISTNTALCGRSAGNLPARSAPACRICGLIARATFLIIRILVIGFRQLSHCRGDTSQPPGVRHERNLPQANPNDVCRYKIVVFQILI